MNTTKQDKGFTLVELLIVIVILGILAGIVIPKFSGRTEQARVAALNMVGQKTELKGVTQINVLDTLGLISASFGNWEGVAGGQHVELTEPDARTGGKHLSLQFADGKLVGCNAIGWTAHVGVMRGLVEGAVPLGEWKDKLLADPTLLMEAYLARAQAQDVHASV